MNGVYTLEQVEDRTGVKAGTLRQRLNRGKLDGIKIPKSEGSKKLVWGMTEAQLEAFIKDNDKGSTNELIALWSARMRTGYHTGNVCEDKTVKWYEQGLNLFFEKVDAGKDVRHVTPDNLRLALSRFNVDEERKQCHFAQKKQVYRSVMSFFKLLVDENIKHEAEGLHFKKYRPKKSQRKWPVIRRSVTEDDLTKLLKVNKWHAYKYEYDRHLTAAMVALMGFGGLRRDEVINLKLADVDLDDGVIWIWDSKNHKNRPVGACNELIEACEAWLKHRAKTESEYFMVTRIGTKITNSTVNKRTSALCNAAGVDTHPHGLRYTFATIMDNRRVALGVIKDSLGHESIETTQLYIAHSQKQSIEAVKNSSKPKEPPKKKRIIKTRKW